MSEAAVPITRAAAPFATVYGEPLTEIPVDLYIPPDALEILLDAFQGPLDLLLYLIRRQNLDVLDIPRVGALAHEHGVERNHVHQDAESEFFLEQFSGDLEFWCGQRGVQK